MSIAIKPHPYKIVCDICNSRDTLTIAKSGVPVSQHPTICRTDLKEIVMAGIQFFGDEIELPAREVAPADYEPMKAEVESLKIKLAASEAKVKELKAIKPKTEPKGRAARSASTMKGGKEK